MAYNTRLADRVRTYLAAHSPLPVTEVPMFGGLNFLVDGKTCVCVSGERLMLRFDPALQPEIAERPGYETMYLRGREYKGYGYIHPEGFHKNEDFDYLLSTCLAYNPQARASARAKGRP